MCRSTGIAAGSGEALVDLAGLQGNPLHDLNLADIYLLLGNYAMADKFADHFLTQSAYGSPARKHAIQILRTARGFLGKKDPYSRGRRPRARLMVGALTMVFGIAGTIWGASLIPPDGRCVGKPELDPTRSDSCPVVYDTLPLGSTFMALGIAASVAGMITIAWPGPPPERSLTYGDPPQATSALAFSF